MTTTHARIIRLPRITSFSTLARWLDIALTETEDETTVAAACLARLDALDERAWHAEGLARYSAEKGVE